MPKLIKLVREAIVNSVLRVPGWTANVSDEDYERLLKEGAVEPEAPAQQPQPQVSTPEGEQTSVQPEELGLVEAKTTPRRKGVTRGA